MTPGEARDKPSDPWERLRELDQKDPDSYREFLLLGAQHLLPVALALEGENPENSVVTALLLAVLEVDE